MLLFDVDGTLTLPRQKISTSMVDTLIKCKDKFKLGLISTSDEEKIKEQLESNINLFEYVFYENGLVFYKNNQLIHKKNLFDYLSKDKIDKFIEYVLLQISKINLPIKNSKFVEIRNGLLNISPIGRDSTIDERNEFEKYDKIHNIRLKMIHELDNQFKHYNLEFCIGGQISFDVYPKGLDKSYCLQYIDENIIHFFGDKTDEGGNDHGLYINSGVIGHKVNSFNETINLLLNLL